MTEMKEIPFWYLTLTVICFMLLNFITICFWHKETNTWRKFAESLIKQIRDANKEKEVRAATKSKYQHTQTNEEDK